MSQPEYRQAGQPERQTPWRLIAFVAIAVVTVVFILQNRERTSIDFLVFEVHARIWTSLLLAVALGVVLDRLFSGWWRRRQERKRA